MSNFLVWFGISLILACLTQAGFTVGDEDLVILWKILGPIAGTIDVIRVVIKLAEEDRIKKV